MIKKIITPTQTVEGDNIILIDVINGIDYVNHGQVSIQDPNRELQGAFKQGDEVSVDIGVLSAGQEATDTIFTGYIEKAIDESIIVLDLDGKGRQVRDAYFKRSYHLVDPARIIRDIVGSVQGLQYELGSIPTDPKRHTWICPNGPVIKELNRVNQSFDLYLQPYFDRDGVLVLKTFAEAVRETGVNFEDGTFDTFVRSVLQTELDPEIFVFDQIQILSLLYTVTSHRMVISEQRTSSLITVTED